ncbi:hypothetical protein ABT034_34905, partial [Streptomyces sp. NPDC002773]|uniref:hypothetical protein n=1 Tax=Streptomyces sp. NPDC002773 TaxID=3154430 RepID=UPI00331F2A31
MIFKIEVLNALVFLLALFTGGVVYRRSHSIESAVVSGAAVAATLVILFNPIASGTAMSETTGPAP